ncbi:MAG: ABC transporter substrate-binding protein [Rhodospirillaceae bacterium]|jgi:phospholipid transport system substrate-binding protein|nr:ABC transporter substrate-binding protein [Rhodospirillaceae bacterium]
MLSRRSFLGTTSAFLAFLLVWALSLSSGYAASGSADDFIKKVGTEAINSLTGKNLSDKERQDRFREILKRTFKIDLIARFTLGRYWRRTTETQKKEYVELFEDFIVQAYAARFKGYSGETFQVGRVRDINARDKLVQSDLVLTDGRKIPVHWRVRDSSDYKIIDVLVEGVSMAITQRDEFAAIINQRGGKIEGLLRALRDKTGRSKKP